MTTFDVIAFDADDTLWHNERLYTNAQARFASLLAAYHPAEWVNARLSQTESRNIEHFGYGIKSFDLMVGNSPRSDILPVLELGGNAVFVPYETVWLHEAGALPPAGQPGYYAIEHIGQLPALLELLERGGQG